MSFSSLWRYIRQFFTSKKDRLDANLIRDYYRRLSQESSEMDDNSAVTGFRQQEVYGRIRKAMKREPPVKRLHWRTVQLAAGVLATAFVVIWCWSAVRETTPVTPMKSGYNALQRGVKKLTLPDGTQVWLNSGSKISYFASNAVGIRTVELKGEAYFDVMRDEMRPFVVHMEKIRVAVLGTSFNVRSYGDEEDVEVFVTAGAVCMAPDAERKIQDGIVLRRNQQVRYNKANDRFTQIDSVDAYSRATWITGNMRYQATPLRIILADLKRRFHINVETDHQLADCLITVDFGSDGPTNALEILAGVLAGHVQYERGIYKLKGTPCK